MFADIKQSVLWGHPCGFSDGANTSSEMLSPRKHLPESSVPQRPLQWLATVRTSSPHAPREMPTDVISPSRPTASHNTANTASTEVLQRELSVGLWPPATSSGWDTLRKAAIISGAKKQFQLFIPKWLPRGFCSQRCEGVKDYHVEVRPSLAAPQSWQPLSAGRLVAFPLLLAQIHRVAAAKPSTAHMWP